jgi:pimeloyl-ACP methyl ester carboxylesterase
MVALLRPENSTNVRTEKLLQGFLTPPQVQRPASERALLSVADDAFTLEGGVPVWSWGDGPIVLFVHGWGGRGTQLGAAIPALVEAGYRVVAFDGPAHGDAPGAHTTLVELATTIAAVAARIGAIDTVIAHSFGAAATTVALHRGVTARRVVFVAPMFQVASSVDRFARGAGLDASARADFIAALSDANRGTHPGDLDGPLLAPGMRAPLLVVHDRGDREVPHDDGVAAARTWPDARLVTTVGLGHRRILEDPHVVDLCRRFADGADLRDLVLDEATRMDRELADRQLRYTVASRARTSNSVGV